MVKTKRQRKACGGVLRAEKAGYQAVIIKGIQYVPCNLSLYGGLPAIFDRLVDRHPDYFVRGEKVWALEWTAELLKALFLANVINIDEMTDKLDKCARMSDTEKKQFILDETMVVEYAPPEMQVITETIKTRTDRLRNKDGVAMTWSFME